MMKICLTCKRFDRVTASMGVCTDNGESVGVNNNCGAWDGDIDKVVELYFEGKSLEEAINIIKKSCRSSRK